MGAGHTRLCDVRDGTQAMCTLGLYTVCTEAPCHRLCFSKSLLFSEATLSVAHIGSSREVALKGPPASSPPQVAGTLPGSLETLDDREGTSARQEGVKAWPQVTRPGIEPLPPVLRRKLHDFLL